MNGVLASFLVKPVMLSGWQHALLLLPLCLSISIVYKTVRCATVREIPMAALVLWVTMVLGMYAVGIGLWLLYLVAA